MSRGLGSPGFIGCLHFGHTWMARHRGFNDEFEHDEYLISQYNSVVNKKDLVYILGDVTMNSPEYYYQLDRLNGRKIVILGNHDNYKDVNELLKYVDGVCGALNYKGYMLTHIPVHPSEIAFFEGNIHAHIHHENELADVRLIPRYNKIGEVESTKSKYFHVDAKLIDFKPKTLNQIINGN